MLGVILLEAGYLVMMRRRSWLPVVLALIPGALILLGVRSALTGAAWWWTALALTASLPFHVADLRRRGWI